MNTETPRLFVAATQQNDGKTTTALGLFSALSRRLGRIGFIKPVGQRFVDVEGHRIDEDTVLIDQTFGVKMPLEAMSPIAVEPDFTRRYIENQNHEFLVRRHPKFVRPRGLGKGFRHHRGHRPCGGRLGVRSLERARGRAAEGKVLLVTKGGIGRADRRNRAEQGALRPGGRGDGRRDHEQGAAATSSRSVQGFRAAGSGAARDRSAGRDPRWSRCWRTRPSARSAGRSKALSSMPRAKPRGARCRKVIIGAMNSTHVMEYFEPRHARGHHRRGPRGHHPRGALHHLARRRRDGNRSRASCSPAICFPHQNVLDLHRGRPICPPSPRRWTATRWRTASTR